MRKRREITAGANRAAAGHARMHATVEQRQQRLERFEADARVAFGQHVGAQRHGRAHGAHRQRRVHAGGMAAQQIQLQRREIGLVDSRLGEIAEAGVDAVDRRVAAGALVDHGARRGHAIARRGRQAHGGAVIGDGEQVGDVEMIAVEEDHRCTQLTQKPGYTETRKITDWDLAKRDPRIACSVCLWVRASVRFVTP
jgi:hypothetical protein